MKKIVEVEVEFDGEFCKPDCKYLQWESFSFYCYKYFEGITESELSKKPQRHLDCIKEFGK